MKKQKDGLVHLRFEHISALNSVRDILYAQKNTMIIAKKIKEYNSLKREENKIQIKLYDKTREAEMIFQKLQKILPRVKSPNVGKAHEVRKIEEVREDEGIEKQLQEIQKRLNQLANQKF